MAAKPMMDVEKSEVAHEHNKQEESLSEPHREYLLQRYGTTELDPLPDMSDADPLNWAKSKKIVVLILVAFHAMMATFTAAAIQSAFVPIALDLGVSVQRASYLTSLFIAVLGGAPLFWRPFANTWGRRPVLLISLIGSLVCNIGCAKSPTFASMAACRALTAWFISPAAAIGSGIVAELFFKSQRARYMGVWTLLVTLGVPTAPFIFGFVALRVDYRWIYYILAMTNGVQLILWLALGFESLYIRGHHVESSTLSLRFRRINPQPLSAIDFIRPLKFVAKPCVFLPTASYAMIFSLAGILITIEIPQLYPEKFHFNTQQVGLQNIAIIIGSVIGELIGGRISDLWMAIGARKRSRIEPEFRLWLSYLAIPLAIAGVTVFLVCIEQAGAHWTVSPDVGAAVAAVGNQIATTVLITYAVDCYRTEAASVGVFVTFVRQIWGFIGPFWYPQMIATVGLKGSAGIAAAMMAVVCFPSSALLQWRGPRWR